MAKKPSFEPNFGLFFSKIWLRQLLDIMVSYHHVQSGPIQESKGICVIFQKKGKKKKKGKKGQNVQKLEIF